VHGGIQTHVRWLERQLDDVTKELAALIEASPCRRTPKFPQLRTPKFPHLTP